VLASGGVDGRITLWKTNARGRGYEILHESSGTVAVSPTTGYLAAGRAGSGLFLYSAAAGSITVPTRTTITALTFDGAGRLITGFDGGNVGLWHVPDVIADANQIRELTTQSSVNAVAADRSGRLWAVAGQGMSDGKTTGVIALSDTRDQLAVVSSGDHDYGVLGLAISTDAHHVVSSGMDGRVIVWTKHAQRWRSMKIAPGSKGYINGVAVSQDGKRIAWAEDSGAVALYDTGTRHRIELSRRDFDRAYSLAFSPDGRLLVAGGRVAAGADPEGAILAWHIDSGKSRSAMADLGGWSGQPCVQRRRQKVGLCCPRWSGCALGF
jgi:WD40 repeat protein